MTIIDAIGNSARIEILRHLSFQAMGTPELAEALGVSPSQVFRHLAILEDLDLVIADHPRGARRAKGRVVLWETNYARAEEVGRTWINYVTGRPLSDSDGDR